MLICLAQKSQKSQLVLIKDHLWWVLIQLISLRPTLSYPQRKLLQPVAWLFKIKEETKHIFYIYTSIYWKLHNNIYITDTEVYNQGDEHKRNAKEHP